MKFLFTFPSMTAAFSADKYMKDSKELSLKGIPSQIVHLPYCLTGTCQGLGLSIISDINGIIFLKNKFEEDCIKFSNLWVETSVEGNFERFSDNRKEVSNRE